MKINILDIIKIAKKAGEAIMEVYDSEFAVELKDDRSPLTLADKNAHIVITNALKELYPEIPILSEEGKDIPYEERKIWGKFWLVDPLDGTKEFIKRNGEFTVNIALIENNRPVLGVIYVPVKRTMYFAQKGLGAYKIENVADITLCHPEEHSDEGFEIKKASRLPLDSKRKLFIIIGSRSHMSKETEEYIEERRQKYGKVEVISSGSSLKFCLIAEGKADAYPRFAPTMEWDTGAGQAIAQEAGAKVIEANSEVELRYNKENLLNPWFLVTRIEALVTN